MRRRPPRPLGAVLLGLALGLLAGLLPAQAQPQVTELVVARAVQAKQPRGIATRFAPGGWIYAWARVDNSLGPTTPLVFVWFEAGQEVSRRPVKIGPSPGWRSWSRHRLPDGPSGPWHVQLQTVTGERLAQRDFTVRPQDAPDPAAEPPEAPAPRAPAPRPEASPVAGPCRALIGLRHDDGRYTTLDLRAQAGRPQVAQLPGLAILDAAGGAHILRVVHHAEPLRGRHGIADRREALLWGQALAGGPPRLWAGIPARIEPPASPGEPRAEHNLLTVHSLLGDHVGVHLALTGRAPEWFDRSRYLTVRAPGVPVDPGLSLPDLPLRTVARLAERHRLPPEEAPDPARHDFRQAAWRAGPRGLRLMTLMTGRAGARLPVDVEAPLPQALGPGPDAEGWWTAPDDCARIRPGSGAIVVQRRGGASAALAIAGGFEAVLGVRWLPHKHRWRASAHRTAWEALAGQRSP